ncbi:MAG: chemotaxis response regulator protein-glutamate methylesterase [Desulfococcaceae bacterium]
MDNNIISVLIVDDSRIFRSIVEESLKNEDDIKVIGSVRNGVRAMEFIRSSRPDIVTLDMEMPDSDGPETLRAIREFNLSTPDLPPVGVIMLSIFTRKGADVTIRALEEGAFDFIAKPDGKSHKENIESLRRQLTAKIRFFISRRVAPRLRKPAENILHPVFLSEFPDRTEKKTGTVITSRIRAVLIGVSTGGPKALMSILPAICEQIDIPLFIVQHMPPAFTASLAGSLNSKCAYTVAEAQHSGIVSQRCAYIAPGGKHMLVRKQGRDVITVLNEQPPENGCRPSVNVLFRSAVPVYGGDVIAVIMTGMGADGSKGIAALKRAGARIIAQDESTSVVWGMPGSAVASGYVDHVIPLQDIPAMIAEIVLKSGNGNI